MNDRFHFFHFFHFILHVLSLGIGGTHVRLDGGLGGDGREGREIARLQVLHAQVKAGVLHGFDVLLALGGLHGSGHVLITRAVRDGAVASAEVVFQVHQIGIGVTHGGASHDAQLRPAFVAVIVLDGVQLEGERRDALVQLLLVSAFVVDEAIHLLSRWVMRGRAVVLFFSVLFVSKIGVEKTIDSDRTVVV